MVLFVVYQGVSHEEAVEGSRWREILDGSLVSHDAVELVSGMCRG